MNLLNLSVWMLLLLCLKDFVGLSLHAIDPFLTEASARFVDLALVGFNLLAALLFLATPRGLTTKILVVAFYGAVLWCVISSGDAIAYLRAVREMIMPVGFLLMGLLIGASGSRQLGRLPWYSLRAVVYIYVVSGLVQILLVRDIKDYWFYSAMSDRLFDDYNYFRNDLARGTGLGVSPFALANLGIGSAALVLTTDGLGYMYEDRERPRLGLLLSASIIAAITAQSRLATISLASLLIARLLRLGMFGSTILLLVLGASLWYVGVDSIWDASVVGRLGQWDAWSDSRFHEPFGAGRPTGQDSMWLDSFVLNFLFTFGWVPLGFYALLFAACFVSSGSFGAWLLAISLPQLALQALEYTIFLPAILLAAGMLRAGRRSMTPGPKGAVLEEAEITAL